MILKDKAFSKWLVLNISRFILSIIIQIESVLSPETYGQLIKEDGKLMQTLIFIVFVYKFVEQQANVYNPEPFGFLNSKLRQANCAKIEKKLVEVGFEFKRNFLKICFRKLSLSSTIV